MLNNFAGLNGRNGDKKRKGIDAAGIICGPINDFYADEYN
jgi:hypothetical protein